MNKYGNDLEALKHWGSCNDLRIAQRAKIILSYIDGTDLSIIAEIHNLPYRAVNRWVKRYQKSGLIGLVDKERSGRKRLTLGKQRKILYFLNASKTGNELNLFSKRLSISKDTIWRKARIGGYKLTRERIFSFRNISFPQEIESSGISGLFITPDFSIAAFQINQSHDVFSAIKYIDVWNRPPEILRKLHKEEVSIAFIDCIKAASIHVNKLRNRAIDEEWQKWLNSLKFTEEHDFEILLLVIGGDIGNKLALKTIRESQVTSKKNGSKHIQISPIPDYAKWLSTIEEIANAASFNDISEQISKFIFSPLRSDLFFSWYRTPDDTEEKSILREYYSKKK